MTSGEDKMLKPRLVLAGDRPISSEEQDFLGLTPFADALAKSLTTMAPDEGIVISVEGKWGAGKTSALALTERSIIRRELAVELGCSLEDIKKRDWEPTLTEWDALAERRRTHVIRFNPWNFSGQENLVRAFFTEVGAVIGHPPDGAVAKAIKKVADHLPTVGSVFGSGVGATAAGLGGIGVGGTLGRTIGEGAKTYLAETESLEEAKRRLAQALQAAAKRIIIVIDDLDRLLPSEMRAMLSLVKSLGDLPGLLYVLAFDREALEEALSKGVEGISSEFLEKIRAIAQHSTGLTLATNAIFRLAGQHGLYGQQSSLESDKLVSSELMKESVEAVVQRIRSAATEGRLLFVPRPLRLLWVWTRCIGPEEPRAWLAQQLKLDQSVLRLASELPSRITVSGADGRREVRRFSAKDHAEILDVAELKERLRNIVAQSGPSSEAARIEAEFLEAGEAQERDPL
jgi:predicted KAP-like P-loop ATPase